MKKSLLLLMLFVQISYNFGQNTTSIDTTVVVSNPEKTFKFKQLIIPTTLVGFGVLGLESDQIKEWNLGIRTEVKEDINNKITIDNFSQFAPAVAVYALNNLGVKGKNNLKDRTVILATSMVFTFITVKSLKGITNQERPDGTDFKSFPSGHTATAFATAEFLYQEYKDVSIWYGISGYVVATGTGMFRLYNNKHWLTDVVAGAGVGILCTKAAYWLHPFINKHLFKSKENSKTTAFVSPFYDGNHTGGTFVISF